MRLSSFFLPTLKETPAEAQIVSHRLMLRAGMIKQTAAGIYAWLPLGLRVLRRIETIVREEHDRFGFQELLMPTIQSADLWRESGRYDGYGKEMLRIKDRHERDLLYGPTNEEMITDIFRTHVKSYRQLPLTLYHIQWKFRDEIRPRFGVMRGREFLMKDAYSFDVDYLDARATYNRFFVCYLSTFRRMGLTPIPVRAETGPIGGDLSHEFHILADTGESELFVDRRLLDLDLTGRAFADDDEIGAFVKEVTDIYAAADDMHRADQCPVPSDDLVTRRGIEVGHIFHFGAKYSQPMGARITDPEGHEREVQMGSYGIGVSRLVGGIIEASHDDAGIVWPGSVAPFQVGVINLKAGDAACDAAAGDFYAKLRAAGVETLYDDTDERAGAKFATMDLIGLPWQVTVGPRSVKAGTVEVKDRASGEREELSIDAALAKLTAA